MTVDLVIERSPADQTGERRRFDAGEMVIGRGDDADWHIDDPEMYVSRRHLVISLQDDRPCVTDTSRGGLFVDGADTALGAGNSRPLEDGMRLRLGDVVIRVEMPEAGAAAAPARPAVFSTGYGFEAAEPEPEPEPRPATLPDPFGFRDEEARRERERKEEAPPPRPIDPDDPFALTTPAPRPQAPAVPPKRHGYFDVEPEAEAPEPPQPAEREPATFGWKPEGQAAAPAVKPAADVDLRDAFLRGMGLDPARYASDDPAADMQEMGRRFRAMVEGLMQLLRVRALEKQKVRVAQTVISSADVNPLKFLATADDALGALVAPRGSGYLGPDAAIEGAFRDLADHQMRSWTALQSSLRRMIDRFDPARIEVEMEGQGLLETLLAGGRHARLWRLYEERYRDIAKSAEDRFLGEVGAEFRDAYEGYRRTR